MIIALYAAIILYASLSSPTPDTISWVEYGVLGLLILSLGLARPLTAATGRGFPLTLSYHRLFFVLMLVVPTIIGFINGHGVAVMIRDIIPLCALILPMCFYEEQSDAMPFVLAIAGGLFALRYIAPTIPQLDFMATETSLLYLANSPLVPFATIMGFAWLSDFKEPTFGKRMLGILLILAGGLAMSMTLQRAPIILTGMACLIILGSRSVHKPIHSMVLGAIIMACVLPFWPLIAEIVQGLSDKTLSVGLNNRVEEFQAVMAQSTWFGYGWGAEFQSPAVGDIWVRYTHNIVTYYWFKAGIVGAVAAIIFVLLWAWYSLKLIKTNIALGLAIFVPFFIHITLYTGFKTLDFALLLTLLSMACDPNESLLSTAHFRRRSAPRDA